MPKTISRNPGILIYTERALQERVEFFKHIGIKNMPKIVSRKPDILLMKPTTMQEKINFLKDNGIKNICKVIMKYPAILTMSVEKNIGPSFVYYQERLKISIDQIETCIVWIDFSLTRLKSCVEYFEHLGIEASNFTISQKDRLIKRVKLLNLKENITNLDALDYDYP